MNRSLDFAVKQISRAQLTRCCHKIYFGLLLCACFFIYSCRVSNTPPMTAGASAQPFTLQDFSGDEYSLDRFAGKVVFIDFWASWCPPCRAAAPILEALYDDYRDKADAIQILGINLDQNREQAEQFIKEKNISYLTLHDAQNTVARAYGVSGIPSFFLINKQGKIVKKYTGFRPSYEQEWREAIDTLLAE